MRLIEKRMDDAAATEAMRGGAIGAIKYCTVALFAGGVLTAVSPRFAAIKPPQKVLSPPFLSSSSPFPSCDVTHTFLSCNGQKNNNIVYPCYYNQVTNHHTPTIN
jgi:hypothetical protein